MMKKYAVYIWTNKSTGDRDYRCGFSTAVTPPKGFNLEILSFWDTKRDAEFMLERAVLARYGGLVCIESGERFQTVGDAARIFGVDTHAIYRALDGDSEAVPGFTLRYLE